MTDFLSNLKSTLEEEYNVSITENGAIGYRTTGKSLLDLNFAVSSLRMASETEIEEMFLKSFYEEKMLALKWLFYLRDVRGGLGERRTFRVILRLLANKKPEYIKSLIKLIPEYGRWDDLLCLVDCNSVRDCVLSIIKEQFNKDMQDMNDEKSISLLAKWLPSVNASSKQTKLNAKKIYTYMGLTKTEYRKSLSKLRAYLDVVERKMSAKQWSEIDYSTVPSRANLIYNNCFLRNDTERRQEFLSALTKGEVKINASTLYPCDIVHKYYFKEFDQTLEELWKALPNNVQGSENTIVVADGSGSMMTNVGSVTALDVANSLAIYFAERSTGEFKDKYITFSENPQLVDLSKGKNLREKLDIARLHCEVANTNIEAVFDLILDTAIKHKMKQEDLPKNIIIISDMEFDHCAVSNRFVDSRDYRYMRLDERLFDVISQRYEDNGYKLPKLMFWNVCSRTKTIPLKENELGVMLVSGFSTNTFKMIMSNKTDPYECLIEVLNDKRYMAVEERLKEYVDLM